MSEAKVQTTAMEDIYFVPIEDRFNEEQDVHVGGKCIPVEQKELMELFIEREDTGDVQLFVDDSVVKAHRAVLTATSDYFKAMFRCDFVESTENEVNVPDFDLLTIEGFLKFIYTGEVHINEANFQEVFSLANQFQVASLIALCVKISTRDLCWDNFSQHYTDAHELALQEHFDMCHDFLAEHFQDLLRNRPLLRDVPPEAILNVLARDDLFVHSEDDLVEIIINWVKINPSEREPALTHILDQIRLPYVSMRELRRLADSFDRNPVLKMKTLRRVMSEMHKNDAKRAKARLHYSTAATPFLNYDGEEENS